MNLSLRGRTPNLQEHQAHYTLTFLIALLNNQTINGLIYLANDILSLRCRKKYCYRDNLLPTRDP